MRNLLQSALLTATSCFLLSGCASPRSQPATVSRPVPALPPPAQVNPPPPGQLPEGIYRVPAQPEYLGVGEKHWIRQNIERGSFILLEDGSLWQVSRLDRIDAALWLRLTNVLVVRNEYGYSGFDYTLINTDDGEKVTAKYVGRR